MNELYFFTFQGLSGIIHQIQIYDKDAADSGSAIELVNESPGYKLSYDLGVSDIIDFGFNPGELEFYVQNKSGELDTFLDDLVSDDENKYLVKLSMSYDGGANFSDKFYGVLLKDFGSVSDNYNQSITFTAVDGLSFIKDVDYTQQSSFLEYITAGLREIPTAEFYGADDKFIFANTQWITDNIDVGGATEPLARINVNDNEVWRKVTTKEGYNGEEITVEEKSSFYEVIKHIITRFRAVLIFADGTWMLFQPDLYDSGTFRSFTKTASYKADETVTRSIISDQANVLRREIQFGNLPALGKVKCNYLTNNDGSLVPTDFNFDQVYTTPPLSIGTGNYLKIELDIKNSRTISTPGSGYHVYKLTVKIGIFYLQDDNSWDTIANEIQFNSDTFYGPSPSGGGTVQGNLATIINTEDIPVSDAAEVKISYDGAYINNVGLTTGSIPPSYDRSWNVTYSINNQTPPDYVSFVAQNTGYSLIHEIEDSLFGSAGSISNGLLEVFTGSIWETTVNRLWDIEGNTPSQFFNELLVNETLSAQSRYKLSPSGSFMSKLTSFIEPFQVVRIQHNESLYYLFPNKVDYNPKINEWSGDYIELSRVEVRLSNEGESIGNGFPDDFGTSGFGTTLKTGYLTFAKIAEVNAPTGNETALFYESEAEALSGYNDYAPFKNVDVKSKAKLSSFTQLSALFINGNKEIAEDNDNYNYDPDTKRITAVNTKMVAVKVHKTETLTLSEAETWTDVRWNDKVAAETIGVKYFDEGLETEDTSILVVDGMNDILEIAGKAHTKWTGAAGAAVRMGIRILSSRDNGTTWIEARCSQNATYENKGVNSEGTRPFTSTQVVNGETYIKLQLWVSSTDLNFLGDTIFDNPVAITLGFNNIGNNSLETL